MFEFEKICKEYEKMSYDERRATLTELADRILPVITLITRGTEAFEVLVLSSCAADGKLSVEEYSLFKDATGLDFSYDDAAALVKAAKGKDLIEAADETVDIFGMLDPEIKLDMVEFCLCICSADNRIGIREKSFIKKLLK